MTGGGSLDDFKFLCFNGKCFCFWVDKDRQTCHKRGFWDINLHYLDIEHFHPKLDSDTTLPNNINKMIKIAEILSADFPHARIDMYNLKGRIVFGEVTFYSSSGYCVFTPDSFDYVLGNYFTEFS